MSNAAVAPLSVAGPAPAGTRLAVTVLYAVAVHLVLALGLHLRLPQPPEPSVAPALEITLVQRPPAKRAPREADYLAEVSSDGGGNQPKPRVPTTVAPGRPQPAAPAP